MHLRTSGLTAACLALVTGLGCTKAPAAVVETAGPCNTVYGAQVCTWSRDSGSTTVALGATIPMAMIDSSPPEAVMAWPPVAAADIPLPDSARTTTGVNHLTVYWEAQGHPPTPFLTPHYDFHFYVISDSQRVAITCADSTKPATLAAGYALPDMDIPGIGHLPGVCVPQMGMHSLPATAMQDSTIFSGTMVLGYYAGHPIFFEPMIARAKLLERKSFSLPLPTPDGVAAGVHYPTKFEAEYDAAIPGYRFVFSGF